MLALALLDAGTPLVWAIGLHLFIGNLIVGLIETVFVRKMFRVPLKWFGYILIIVANYCSMFVGLLIIGQNSQKVWIEDKDVTPLGILIALTVTLLVSIVVEFPFYYASIKPVLRDTSGKRAFAITVSAQVISYIGLVVYYLLVKFF
jgi:hypothetical protein